MKINDCYKKVVDITVTNNTPLLKLLILYQCILPQGFKTFWTFVNHYNHLNKKLPFGKGSTALLIWRAFLQIIDRCQGRSQGFSKGGGGHTLSKWGYSSDCHVDLHAVFWLNVTCFRWAVREVGRTSLQNSFWISSVLTAHLSKYLLTKGGMDDEGQRCWWSHQYFD